jgi:hypothetical protein
MAAVLLPACTVEVINTQARQDVLQDSAPPGSVYTGWRVFQDRCATRSAPPRVRTCCRVCAPWGHGDLSVSC